MKRFLSAIGGAALIVMLGGAGPFQVPGLIVEPGGSVSGPFGGASVLSTGTTTSISLSNRFAQTVNVMDYGAVTGTTDSSAAFAAAYAAAPAGSVIQVPYGAYTLGSAPTGSKHVLWDLNGSIYQGGTTPVGSLPGINETVYQNAKSFSKAATGSSSNDYATVRADLTSSVAGVSGEALSNYVSNMTISGTPVFSAYGVSSGMQISSNGTQPVVAVNGVGFRASNPGTGVGNPIFGGTFAAEDHTFQNSSISGTLVGAEVDVYGNGLDNFISTSPSALGIRSMMGLIYGQPNDVVGSGIPIEVSNGLYIGPQNQTNSQGYLRRGIQIWGQYEDAGIDLSNLVTYGSSVRGAILLASGQAISFEPTAAVNLRYISANNALVSSYPVQVANGGFAVTGTLSGVGFDASPATISIAAFRSAAGQKWCYDVSCTVNISEVAGVATVAGGNLGVTGIIPSKFTVATLPTCNSTTEGLRETVTDATAPTWLGALTGGGTVVAPAFCNGSAWVGG